LLSYADFQFGKPILGKDYRERLDGQRIDNWDVDICILLNIGIKIFDMFTANSSLSTIVRDKGMFPHLERSLHIVNSWMVTIDSQSNQCNILNSTEINLLLQISCKLEFEMSSVAIHKNQFDIAEGHCHRSLINSRRFAVQGEDKTTAIFNALRA
jgi:hypothetical protein